MEHLEFLEYSRIFFFESRIWNPIPE